MIDRSLNKGRPIIKKFLSNSTPYTNVLDIGAGKGDDLLTARDIQKSCILYGLDCYQPNIEILQSKSINVKSINLESEKFPFANETFDIIIANQILEHTKELFWIFHEISRTLKVNGHCIIGVPNLASLHNRILLLFGRQPTCITLDGPHVRGFTKKEFLSFTNNCWKGGYDCVGFAGSNFYPFSPSIATILAHQLPRFAVCIFFLLKKSKSYNNEFIKILEEKPLETNFFKGEI